MIYFKSAVERLEEVDEMVQRKNHEIKYGISFLDDALNGIYPDDLILITAKTGGGKTEIASSIAYNAASAGKKVYYFALEAHNAEIEARIKFKLLSNAFYTQQNWKAFGDTPDYQNWINGRQADLLNKFLPEINSMNHEVLKNLNTHYSDHEFNIETFESMMGLIGSDCDLVILDHIHHMDLMDDNENRALKRTVRQIKKIVSFYRKPMIVIAQMRKTDKRAGQLLPDIDDLHGVLELAKIATRIIASAPARDQEQADKTIYPTYIKILKNRLSSARTFYTALCGYSSIKNDYEPCYFLGTLKKNDTEFVQIGEWEHPRWFRPVQGKLL